MLTDKFRTWEIEYRSKCGCTALKEPVDCGQGFTVYTSPFFNIRSEFERLELENSHAQRAIEWKNRIEHAWKIAHEEVEISAKFSKHQVLIQSQLMKRIFLLREALKKVADPTLRDHKEPDVYTENGCLMNLANEALKTDEGLTYYGGENIGHRECDDSSERADGDGGGEGRNDNQSPELSMCPT